MKQIFSAMLAALFVISSVTLPSLPAQAGVYSTSLTAAKELGQTLAVSGEKLSLKYSVKEGESILVSVSNKSGELLKDIQIRAGSAAELEKVKPSKLSAILEDMKDGAAAGADDVNFGQMGKDVADGEKALTTKIDPKAKGNVTYSKNKDKKANLAMRALKLAGHELVQFPVQSFGFFIAIGANVAEKAIFNYADDPVGFEHFITGQVDPVGQIGFYMFMLANAGASKPMMAMIEKGKWNPRLRGFIPYLGMSLGMIASNITSEIGNSEGIKACVAQVMGGKKQAPLEKSVSNEQSAAASPSTCDEAYSNWTKKGFWNAIGGTALDWAPGLSSMLVSSVVMWAIQVGALKIAERIVTIGAVQVAMAFLPGGFAVKAIQVVGWVVQMAMFTRVSEVIDPFFTQLLENLRQGLKLSDIEKGLVTDLVALRDPSWDGKDLTDNLNNLKTAMKAWRGMNSMQVSAAQSNWIENLNNFSGLYNASKGFYAAVVSDLANTKKFASTGYTSNMMRNIPLNGIFAAGYNGQHPEVFFNQPDDAFEMQMATVKRVSAQADAMYANNQAFLNGLNSDGRKVLTMVLDSLRSQDPNAIGKALDRMNLELASSQSVFDRVFSVGVDGETLKALQSIKAMLGFPKPIWEKTTGFAYYYMGTPDMKDSRNLSYFCGFQMDDGIKIDNLCAGSVADWLIASAMLGPDVSKHESVVGTTQGFYSKFLAPRLPMTPNATDGILFCGRNDKVPMAQATLCRGANEKYDNPLDFVSQHIDPSILEDHAFDKWWKDNAETPYVKTWVDFENKYQPIVAEMIEKLWRTDQGLTNFSDVGNGLFKSSVQELNVYSLMLGGVIRATLEHRGQNDYMQKLLSLNHPNRQIKVPTSGSTLMSAVLEANLDMNSVLQSQGNKHFKASDKTYNFIWQNYILSELSKFETLLRQIKVTKTTLSTGETINVTSSQLTNQQIENQQAEVMKALEYAETVVKTVNLPKERKQIAELCLANMKEVIGDLTTMAKVANAVSYRELTSTGTLAKKRCTKASQGSGNGLQFAALKDEGCQ